MFTFSNFNLAKLSRKKLHTAAILALAFLVLLSFLSLVSVKSDIVPQISAIKVSSIDSLASRLSSVTVGDPDAALAKSVENLYHTKVETDVENKFWRLNTKIAEPEIEIPFFYRSSDSQKPSIQPFDPRFTIGVYYHHIKKQMAKDHRGLVSVPFHWYDWLDMSVLNKYLLANPANKGGCELVDARPENDKNENKGPDPATFCISGDDILFSHDDGNSIRPGFNVFTNPGRSTSSQAILAGQSYLYTFAPPPSRMYFLTKDGYYDVATNSRKKLLDSGLVEEYVKDTHASSINIAKEFKSLQRKVPSNKEDIITAYEVEIPEESFHFKWQEIINEYETKILGGKQLSKLELRYYQSLKYSAAAVALNGGPPKYFAEARLHGTTLGDHYDWRFFNGVMYGTYEQTLVLHRLVRTWLSFCRKVGITTWVAHGSLLSWYWNGFAFPWDNDVDVQVPIMDLHKLSLHHNQTFIVEDTEDGYGRYFLDCGTFITLREKGNGENNIDARFIDVDTGLYVDITGLALSNTRAPDRYRANLPDDLKEKHFEANKQLKTYNCRNNHFSSLDELSPMVKTFVEGEIGYVPRGYTDILQAEYSRGLLSKTFQGHVFLPQLRLWLKEYDLFYFLNDREKWNKYHNYNIEYAESLGNGDVKFDENNYEYTEDEKKHGVKQGDKIVPAKEVKLTDEDIEKVMKFRSEDLLEFLQKDDVFMYYYTTQHFTAFHEEEIMRLSFGKSSEKLVNNAPDFQPMLVEPFEYYIHNNYVDYTDEVNKYVALEESYRQQDAKQEKQKQTT